MGDESGEGGEGATWGGGRGGKAAIGVGLWAVGAVGVVGVVRAVRARGGVGMHWQPLNTLIYTMQAIGKAKGRPAIGRLGGEGDEENQK